MLLEENCTVIPAGREPVESATLAVKLLPGVTVIVVDAEPPGVTDTLDGAAVKVNEPTGFAVTVTGMTTVLVRLPLVPLMVIESGAATAA